MNTHALAWSLLSHWQLFAGVRALPNAWESVLTAVALALLFGPAARFSHGVGWDAAALAVVLRASLLPLWAFITSEYILRLADALHQTKQKITVANWLFMVLVQPALVIIVTTVYLDTVWYGVCEYSLRTWVHEHHVLLSLLQAASLCRDKPGVVCMPR